MLLTLKNKTCLAMDVLIKEAKEKGGIPARFTLDPQEGVDFLKEVIEFNEGERKNIVITQQNKEEADARFLLKSPLIKETAQFLLDRWYSGKITISYKGVDIKIKKKPALPKPVFPPNQIIKEGDTRGKCVICGSSMHRKWFFWSDGCIQPQCKNYYLTTTDCN